MIVVWLFLTMLQVCLQFVVVIFIDHTNLLFQDLNWFEIVIFHQKNSRSVQASSRFAETNSYEKEAC